VRRFRYKISRRNHRNNTAAASAEEIAATLQST